MHRIKSLLERLAEFIPYSAASSLRNAVNSFGNLSLLQRLSLAFLLVTILGSSTSLVGLWFANSAAQSVSQVQRGSDQIQAIERLQREWYGVISNVDLLLLTRSLAGLQVELQTRLDDFREQYQTVRYGIQQETDQESTAQLMQIIQEIDEISLELDQFTQEFFGLVQGGRWGSAQTLRYTQLSSLQIRLQENLSLLNQWIQEDVRNSVAVAQQRQSLAQGLWIVAVLVALLFSLGISWFSSQAIARPINQLTEEVKGVTATGKSTPGEDLQNSLRRIQPTDRKDEIGEVWQAFATLTDWLSEAYQTLEERVVDRTMELERRSQQVQIAAEIARDITSIRLEQQATQQTDTGLTNLLDKAVNLIRDRLGFYHAGIFLTDDWNEYTVLRAATGEAGKQMLSGGHRLKIGEVGLVGSVAESGIPRIALDVGKDAIHFRNPFLPETRSEVALPLRTGDNIIGVLDVQSQQTGAFDEQDIVILQIIADQLTTAIENTRLFTQLGINLQELESYYTTYSRQSWEQLARLWQINGFEYDGESVRPIQDEPDRQWNTVDSSDDGVKYAGQRYWFPIKLRGEVIANLELWSKTKALSGEEINVLNMYTSRVSQILESARLFNEAQQRASREQLLNELTSTIVRAIDPQSVLFTAARQLERLPSITKAAIYLSGSQVADQPESKVIKDSQA